MSLRFYVLNMEENRCRCQCLQIYAIIMTRKQIPRYVRFSEPALAIKYECPVSLSALYCPITVKGSDPRHTFSAPILDEFTKTSKTDPLTELPLEADWRIEDFAMDTEMGQVFASIPLSSGGMELFGVLPTSSRDDMYLNFPGCHVIIHYLSLHITINMY